jgi:hypothetical protein
MTMRWSSNIVTAPNQGMQRTALRRYVFISMLVRVIHPAASCISHSGG